MNTKTNVTVPMQFKEKLIELMGNVYELFELTKEQNLEPVTDDGCTQYTEEHGKCVFRGHPATHFGVSRPVISASSGHLFRCDPASRFGIIRPPVSV